MSDPSTLTQLTAKVVAAYLITNPIAPSEIATLICSVHSTLRSLAIGAVEPTPSASLTAAQIRRSITPDGLVSFEDGRRYQRLKPHLASRGLTPAEYRAKWALPDDYPLVAPGYSAARSVIAKAAGFGRKSATESAPEPPPEPMVAESPKARIRGKLSLFTRTTPGDG